MEKRDRSAQHVAQPKDVVSNQSVMQADPTAMRDKWWEGETFPYILVKYSFKVFCVATASVKKSLVSTYL